MEFGLSEELTAFRDEVRAFARQYATAELEAETGWQWGTRGPLLTAAKAEIERRGWAKIGLPEEFGGTGASPWHRFILIELLSYHGISMTDLSTGSIAPAIIRFGTEEQKRKYLPAIWDKSMTFAIGYSEPNAGTDLASLETRAERDGDDWVINGQKIWTSGAHNTSHVWLAARTDPKAPKHRGISMFIVPLATPGVSVRPIWVISGDRTNETFYEDVRVGADALIGEEGRGWYTAANALDHERVTIAPFGELAGLFDSLIETMKRRFAAVLADRAARLRLAEVKLDVHVQRALKVKNVAIIAEGSTPTMEASMAKVWASEFRYHIASIAMDLFGRYGTLEKEDAESPAYGAFEWNYLWAPVQRFGGGTNEVQRNIVAQRGLGLPR